MIVVHNYQMIVKQTHEYHSPVLHIGTKLYSISCLHRVTYETTMELGRRFIILYSFSDRNTELSNDCETST